MSMQTLPSYSPGKCRTSHAEPSKKHFAMNSEDLLTATGASLLHMEDYPVATRPIPTAFDNMGYLASIMEPALCITPEKQSTQVKSSPRSINQVLGVGPRVRFDNVVDIRHVSPKSPCKDVNMDIIDIGMTNSSLHNLNGHSVGTEDSCLTDGQEDGNCFAYNTCTGKYTSDSKGQTVAERNYSNTQRHFNVTQKKSATSKSKKGRDNKICDITGNSHLEVSDNILSQPEFNSTLRLGLALQEACKSELDPHAAEDLVLNFESARRVIEEKATQKVNWQTVAYRNLISVDVDASSLSKKLERERKPVIKIKQKLDVCDTEVPNILDLLKKDYQKETVSYGGACLTGASYQPQTASSVNAFDIYMHVRSWDP